jgi:ribosome-associated translation inhibitor RaiA
MYFPDNSKLRVEWDTKQCDFAAADMERFYEGLHPLEKVVEPFPVTDLYVTIRRNPRSKDYHVTTALHVPSRTLFTGERHDEDAYTAFERCIRKLVGKVGAHKDLLSNKPEQRKSNVGTRQELLPDYEPDVTAMRWAASEGDYREFRGYIDVYHEAVRLRVGRWIQRYPAIEAKLGLELSIDDVVEDVFLAAFDGFRTRPDVRFGEWLETLIHQAVHALARKPDAEKENVSFARSYAEG